MAAQPVDELGVQLLDPLERDPAGLAAQVDQPRQPDAITTTSGVPSTASGSGAAGSRLRPVSSRLPPISTSSPSRERRVTTRTEAASAPVPAVTSVAAADT